MIGTKLAMHNLFGQSLCLETLRPTPSCQVQICVPLHDIAPSPGDTALSDHSTFQLALLLKSSGWDYTIATPLDPEPQPLRLPDESASVEASYVKRFWSPIAECACNPSTLAERCVLQQDPRRPRSRRWWRCTCGLRGR